MTSGNTPASASRRRRRRRSVGGLALATLAPALAAGLSALGLGVATAPAAQAAVPGCTSSAIVTTCVYSFTGAPQDWTVPAGVHRATFTVLGAAGGDAYIWGGRGGGVHATIPVTPLSTMRLYVGGRGGGLYDAPDRRGRGGWNGGGDGGLVANGAGGGGASDVRVAPYGLADRELIGGGGGGSGSSVTTPGAPVGAPGGGGAGGGFGDGQQGLNVSGGDGAGGGGGGSGPAGGAAGGASGGILGNGCGDFAPAVGVDGRNGRPDNAAYQGGYGGYLRGYFSGKGCYASAGFGGGGGGGWGPGGGGGGGITGGAGGGGGSGHAPPGSASAPPGDHTSDGKITISYLDPSSGWASLGGGPMTSAPTTVARPSTGKLAPIHDVFYLNELSAVIQRTVTEGVPGPEANLGATLSAGSRVAAVWRSGGRLDIFGRGTENALWQKSYTAGTGWGYWHAITGAAEVFSDPSAASLDGSRLDVFYRGSDSQLHQVPIIAGTPQQPIWLGGRLVLPPAAVNKGNGFIEVYTGENVGTGTAAMFRRTWTGGGWLVVPADLDRSFTSAASVSSLGQGTVGMAFRNTDSGVSVTTNVGGGTWPTWQDLQAPSPAGSAPALQSTLGSGGVVYLRGFDGTLMTRAIG